MAKFQLIGDEQKLSKGPRSAEPHGFSGGKFQLLGDQVKMSEKPVPLQQYRAGTGHGKFQNVGDKVSLSETPHKGWNSYNTPISERNQWTKQMPGKKKGS